MVKQKWKHSVDHTSRIVTNIIDRDKINKPRRRRVKLKAVPRKGEIYWCDYPPPECLHLPEFWKRRPVVILSRNATLRGIVMVVPMTSQEQSDPYLSVQIQSPINSEIVWVICNHITTVAVSRLLPVKGRPVVSRDIYQDILREVLNNLANA
ncbi:MAG: type II toxin-antitoxin system PemK/MazF family toxin [Aestuariivita sp.]|nr:type II toxin-antitoxin system PemK/MazF family toxin [Aestuariivita sp.]